MISLLSPASHLPLQVNNRDAFLLPSRCWLCPHFHPHSPFERVPHHDRQSEYNIQLIILILYIACNDEVQWPQTPNLINCFHEGFIDRVLTKAQFKLYKYNKNKHTVPTSRIPLGLS